MERATWSNRSTFILAAVGSAIGLGNVWRFPGLAAKHGGGAFLLAFLIGMFVIGIPLLMMEIAIGRKMHRGAPAALRGMNKKFEPVGWMSVTNAFVISTYYAIVYAWVIAMIFASVKFLGMVGDSAAAERIFTDLTQTTGTVSAKLSEGYKIPIVIFVAAILAWISIYYCIRNGTESVGKVVKYTVFLPIICLIIMGLKGITMPGAFQGIQKFFQPDFSAFRDPSLWIDAFGQVFYSLSIMMAVMFAYGSFLDNRSNVAVDTMIIAFFDLLVSILAGIVMFSTLGGVGMLDSITATGVSSAFVIYPQAIVNLTNSGLVNMIFGILFYICLATLAIDSAFSIIEGVSTAIADKFSLSHKKTTKWTVIISAIISIVYCTRDGLAWLDIVDNFTNQYTMIIVGVLECICIGWFFNTTKVLKEINKNTKIFKMPSWWFVLSVRYISPIALLLFCIWNFVDLFKNGGIYGANSGYTFMSNMIGGWTVILLSLISGWIIKIIARIMRKKDRFSEDKTTWDNVKS